MNLMPKNYSGKWAVGFGIVLFVSITIQVVFAAAIGGNSNVIDSNIFLSVLAGILSITFSFAGPASLFMGIYTVVKYKDWSVFKSLGIFYAITFIIFMLAEFLFPH
jgi:hypothetical protein